MLCPRFPYALPQDPEGIFDDYVLPLHHPLHGRTVTGPALSNFEPVVCRCFLDPVYLKEGESAVEMFYYHTNN